MLSPARSPSLAGWPKGRAAKQQALIEENFLPTSGQGGALPVGGPGRGPESRSPAICAREAFLLVGSPGRRSDGADPEEIPPEIRSGEMGSDSCCRRCCRQSIRRPNRRNHQSNMPG